MNSYYPTFILGSEINKLNSLINNFELKTIDNINYILGYDKYGLLNFKAESLTGKIRKTDKEYINDINNLNNDYIIIEPCEDGWMLVPEVPF